MVIEITPDHYRACPDFGPIYKQLEGEAAGDELEPTDGKEVIKLGRTRINPKYLRMHAGLLYFTSPKGDQRIWPLWEPEPNSGRNEGFEGFCNFLKTLPNF
eukprot:SAG22_NODE_904_length_6586_cov_3.133498_7_plen_101_part_00